ncbi:unnamed protein product [Rhodiola kirilowii]
MAQFTSIKPLLDGDSSARMKLEQKGVFLCYDNKYSILASSSYLIKNKAKQRSSYASRLRSSSSSSAASIHHGSSGLRIESSPEMDEDDRDGVYEVCYDDNFEFHKDDLDCFRGLVLDVSYRFNLVTFVTCQQKKIGLMICVSDKSSRPINVVCWRRAICLEFLEKADVLEYYDQTVNSPSGSFYIPAVLRIPHLLTVVKRRRVKSTLSRKSILYRDNYTCQYCSSHENLTIDHVLPIARGGVWKWENLVAACSRCNSRKGQKTVEEANMKLMKTPKPPKDFDIVAIPLTSKAIQTLRMRKETPEEWHQYLSMPSAEP